VDDIFNIGGDLERWLHLRELEQASSSVFVGAEVDPLRVLMDPNVTEPWEYEHSRTEPFIPGSMHPKQVEALASESRFRWLFWANQTGKTTTGAIDIALTALGRHPNQKWQAPLLLWASALTWDLWENILLPELLTWIPPERIIDAPEPRMRSTKRVILVRADNGRISRIVGKSAEQGAAKYQSARVHKVWMDEEHPESVWDEVQPRLLRHGGEVITTATPLLGLTWLYHRIYDPWKRGRQSDHYCSHAGLADNPSIDPKDIAAITKEFEADPQQAEARLYGRFATPTGIALRFDPNKHLESWTPDMKDVVKQQKWRHVCGVDFGYWRFAFVHLVVDRAGRAHVVGEVFSQKQDLTVRAKKIHDHLTLWDAPKETRLWGDAANPTDIVELNRELTRINSPYRVRPVRAENKARQASVTLTNKLLARQALMIRRNLNERQVWRLGQNAAADGRPQVGSRLMYEIAQWRYPKPKDGEAQAQDPADRTADGADMVAALRYAVMSQYRAAEFEIPVSVGKNNRDSGLEKLNEQIKNEEDYGA
jgi:phage terminase large subunit-like protein